MGFLSSLFQTGTPAPQVAGPVMSASGIPKELAPYYKDILGKAQALYDEKTAEGFKPYTGPTLAEFSPEQQQAFTGLSGLVGGTTPVFQEGMQMTRDAAAPMTSEQITSYMSPYQQAVTDIEKREATKQYETQVQPQLAAQAAKIQPFGGSRQAILEGMAADTQQRLLGDIQAKGSQQAYQDAVNRLQAERAAQGKAGAQLATMAPNLLKTQMAEFGSLQNIGQAKQQQSQTALDEAFRQYTLEQNYPYDTMSKYQSTVTGAPLGQTQFAPPAAPVPSIGQQLIGGLGTIGATYGAFGGKLPQIFSKEGGGIADALPIVYRQDKGQVLNRESVSSLLDIDLEGVGDQFIVPEGWTYNKLDRTKKWKGPEGEQLHPFYQRAIRQNIPPGSQFEVVLGTDGKPVFRVVAGDSVSEDATEKNTVVAGPLKKLDTEININDLGLSGRTSISDSSWEQADKNLQTTTTRLLKMNDYIDQLIEDNPLISKEELHKQIKDNYDVSIKQIDDYVDQKKDFQKKAFEDDLADQKKIL